MPVNILFITDIVPSESMASAVVFYRHFKLLEKKGYIISILTHNMALNIQQIPSSWNLKLLPARRWWYPPYRPHNLLKWLRYYILYAEAKTFLNRVKPDMIIGYMSGVNYAGFAAFVAEKKNRPLAVFYHDSTEQLYYHNDKFMQKNMYTYNAYVIDKADVVWAISPKLVYNNLAWQHKFKVVYPIPMPVPEKAKWSDANIQRPVLANAGSVYNEVVDIMVLLGKQLQKFNGSLLLMTPLSDNIDKIQKELTNIIAVHPRKTTLEACNFISKNATAFVVAYPENISDMPWIISSFASKFTQFIQTGLPVLVLAPAGTAIAEWCVRNNWKGYLGDYSAASIDKIIISITDEKSWKIMAQQSNDAANGDFSEQHIQAIIELDIEALTGKVCKSSANAN